MSVFEHEFKWTDSKSRVFGGDFFLGGGGIKLLIDAAQIFIKNIYMYVWEKNLFENKRKKFWWWQCRFKKGLGKGSNWITVKNVLVKTYTS